MTALDLDRLLALREQATGGEWVCENEDVWADELGYSWVAQTLTHDEAVYMVALHNAAPDLIERAREADRLREELAWLTACAADTLDYIEAGHRLTHAEPVGDRCLTNCSEAWHVERDSLRNAIRDARAALSPSDGGTR